MNPSAMFQVMEAFKRFQSNHPKVVSYVKTVFGPGLPEGTVLEITCTKPGEEPVTTNMKITQDDLDLLQSLKNIQG
ncbi:MAG: hypothetical protein K6G04_07335 [Lachnospiraceae bacterium]|nr:hypothetical protein [Lachnospiraceae bacterium]